MSWDGAYYESRSVKVSRGAEDRTIDQWEQAGWEVVGAPTSGRRTEIFFRRVNRPSEGVAARPPRQSLRDRPAVLAGAGAAVLLVVGGIVLGAGGDDLPAPAAAAGAATAPEKTEKAEKKVPPADGVVTVDNSDDLATIIDEPTTCSVKIADFASTFAGRTIELDAQVEATAARPGSTYDLVVRTGDSAVKPAIGPALAIQGVTLEGLHLAAGARDYVSAGDDVVLTAEVAGFDATSCYLSVVPVATELR